METPGPINGHHAGRTAKGCDLLGYSILEMNDKLSRKTKIRERRTIEDNSVCASLRYEDKGGLHCKGG